MLEWEKMETGLEKKLLFNPNGERDWSKRKLIGGNPTNIMELSRVTYPWASKLYRQMMENFWIN